MPQRSKIKKVAQPPGKPSRRKADPHTAAELVIITGMSGSGKASALKAFEDLGYYCVDNLPVELIPRFAELALQSGEIPRTALVFDVRFLPNPHFVPEFRALTGRDPRVAKYIRSFPQTQEFINRISELLIYLLPHYIREGKSYLTISFGCTGGQHRSVMIAEDVNKRLRKAGYKVKVVHRDSPK